MAHSTTVFIIYACVCFQKKLPFWDIIRIRILWTSDMAQQVLTAKPNYLNPIPKTQMEEKKKSSKSCPLMYIHAHCDNTHVLQ